MGRFYRQTNATPVDYMYRINTPLLESVLNTNEGYINQELGQADQLGQLTQFNHLGSDNDAAKQLSDNYMSQVDDISKSITQDPANWRKQVQPIKDLTRNLQTDYTSGPISKYISNYTGVKKDLDAVDAGVALYQKTGGQDKNGNAVGIDPERAAYYKRYINSSFDGTNYNPTDKSYKTYQSVPVLPNMDVQARLSKGLDKLKDDGYSFTNDDITKGGQYINKTTGETKSITPERLLGILSDRIGGDGELMNYLKQNQQIGYSRGVFNPQGTLDAKGNDISGRLISPYTVNGPNDSQLSSIEQQRQSGQQQIDKVKDPAKKQELQGILNNSIDQLKNKKSVNWNNDSYLSPILQGIVGQYAHSDTKQSNELKANPIWTTQFTQAQENHRQGNSLRQAWQIHTDTQKALQTRFDENQAWDKEKFYNPQAKPGTTKNTKGDGTVDNSYPTESIVSKIGNNTLKSLTVKDPDSNLDIPLMSNKGMVTNWRQLGATQNVLDQQVKDISSKLASAIPGSLEYNQFLSQKESLQKQSLQNNAELKQTASWVKQTEDAVLSNDPQAGSPLDQKDISVYKEFAQNGDIHGDKFKASIDKLKQQYPDVQDKISAGNFVSAGINKLSSLDKDRSEANSELNPWARKSLTYIEEGHEKGNTVESPQVQAARAKLASFYKAQNNIVKNKDTYLKNLSTDYITSDAIIPSKQDADAARNIILNDPSGSVIYDGKSGANLSDSHITPSFKWTSSQKQPYSMSFEGDNNLKNYIDETGTTMNIDKIGATTGVGNGTSVVKVSFNDPTGKLQAGKPYYISVNENTAKALGNRFKSSRNPDISGIGNNMLDDYSNSIKNQFAKGNSTILFKDGLGNTFPLNIEKLDNGKIVASYKTSKGATVGFPRVKDLKGRPVGGLDGIYTNIDDLIQHSEEQNNLQRARNQ